MIFARQLFSRFRFYMVWGPIRYLCCALDASGSLCVVVRLAVLAAVATLLIQFEQKAAWDDTSSSWETKQTKYKRYHNRSINPSLVFLGLTKLLPVQGLTSSMLNMTWHITPGVSSLLKSFMQSRASAVIFSASGTLKTFRVASFFSQTGSKQRRSTTDPHTYLAN